MREHPHSSLGRLMVDCQATNSRLLKLAAYLFPFFSINGWILPLLTTGPLDDMLGLATYLSKATSASFMARLAMQQELAYLGWGTARQRRPVIIRKSSCLPLTCILHWSAPSRPSFGFIESEIFAKLQIRGFHSSRISLGPGSRVDDEHTAPFVYVLCHISARSHGVRRGAHRSRLAF